MVARAVLEVEVDLQAGVGSKEPRADLRKPGVVVPSVLTGLLLFTVTPQKAESSSSLLEMAKPC